MVVLEYLSTTMTSLASPMRLGSDTLNISGYSRAIQRVSLSRNVSKFWVRKRCWVCKYSVTTYYITGQGTSVSLNSTYRGRKHNDAALVVKASKPVLGSGSKTEALFSLNSVSAMPWDILKLNEDSEFEKLNDDKEEIGKVIESLGEAMEKVEKLESSTKVGVPVDKSRLNTSTGKRKGKLIKLTVGRKSKTWKSVWRKGDAVASVQKVVKESQKSEKVEKQESRIERARKVASAPISPLKSQTSAWRKGDAVPSAQKTVEGSPKSEKVEKHEGRIEGAGKVASPPIPPLRPPKPFTRVQPKLHPKLSTAPPSPMIKKPVLMKDVGEPPKDPATGGNNSVAKTKERKPILIDNVLPKKPVVDPLIARAVLAPPKSAKCAIPGKSSNDFRKKSGPSGVPRRQIVSSFENPDEELELDVSIRGASTARKGRKWSKASRKAARLLAAKEAAPVKEEILEVGEEGMLTEELAHNLAISEGEILGYLYSKGMKPDGVQTLDKNMVKMICKDYEVEVIDVSPIRVEEKAKRKEILEEEDLESLEDRPPVLTIMGHVDHGKTTLLDYIRKSKVAASEAGGITQGIGAYKVLIPIDGKFQPCVFLDTPGHEAFGAMRARGAKVTDIAIIVVAADDGIRPQTNEAIAHAKAAGVPIVIAINKIDKDGANPEKVILDLSAIGLMPDDWGGDIPMVQISALKGENISELLEIVMLVAELQELKANPRRSAKGTVIEAGLHKSKGPLATFIVQNGTLKRGDIVVCGEAFGKIRALFDDSGNRVDEAGPSIPVQVIGLNNVPMAGDEFEIVGSLDVARKRAASCAESLRNQHISAKAGDGKITLSSFASAVSAGKQSKLLLHQLNIVMKVDLQGSIEAVRQALKVLPQDNVTLKFLLQATGDVSTSDVDLAVATKGIILGFNVKAPGTVKSYADNKGVEIRLYRVIYELIDDVRNAMEGLLEPVEEQETIGAAEVRAVFSRGSGCIAGCMVTEGEVVKDCGIRIIRNGKTIHIGVLNSLRRVKEIVKEVNAGLECGIRVEDFSDWEVGDILEAFNTLQKQQTLEEASAAIEAVLKGEGIEL